MPHSRDAHPLAATLLRRLAAVSAAARGVAGRLRTGTHRCGARWTEEDVGALVDRMARACGADGVMLVDRDWRILASGPGAAWPGAEPAPGTALWDAVPELRNAAGRLRACRDGRGGAVVLDDGAVLVHAMPVGRGLALWRRPARCDATAAQELSEARRRVDRTHRAQVRFLESINHDLRQPAQSIGLLVEVLGGRRLDGTAGRAVHALGQAAAALGMIVQGLGGVEAADAVGAPRPLALAALLDRLAAEYAPRMAEAGLTLRAVPTRAWARSDPAGLERAVRALLDNALRFTPGGGVLLGCRREGRRIRVEVVDTGIGIADGDLDCIFEPLHQIGNPERDRRSGLGLGLTTVRRICTALGHDLRVRSAPGRGSTFALVLERAEPGADDEGEPRVLLIGAAPLFAVGGWNIPVRLATTVAEAEAALAGGARPAVVVVPAVLADGTPGVEAAGVVRRALGSPIPAAVLTDGDRDEAAAAAAYGCVAIAPDAPSDWLARLLSGTR